jgi:lysophospholipase
MEKSGFSDKKIIYKKHLKTHQSIKLTSWKSMASLKNTSTNFSSPVDGIELYYQKWLPETSIERIIVIHHGLGEHSGRYQNLLKAMNDSKTAIYALDARGHGKSSGIKGHVGKFDFFARDLGALIQLVRDENPEKKLLLFGHSMGGLILLDFLIRESSLPNIQGAIISSPAIMPVMDLIKTIKKGIAGLLTPFIPAVTMESGLDLNFLSHDQDVINQYRADPLVHGKISIQLGMSLFTVPEKILNNASKINLPVLIIHGSGDGMVSFKGSQNLYEKISSSDKTLKIFDGLYHELINEKSPDKEKVLDILKEWLNNHS